MDNVLPHPPVRLILSTLNFYVQHRNFDLLPIPDPVSIEFMFHAALAIHEGQPIPVIRRGQAENLIASIQFLIRDLEICLRIFAADDPEQEQYRNSLRFALRLEFAILGQLNRRPRNPRNRRNRWNRY